MAVEASDCGFHTFIILISTHFEYEQMGVLSIEAAFQSIPNRSFRYPTLAAAAALAASQMMLELVLPHL